MPMAATHSSNRKLHDAIFEASKACQDAAAIHGADAVTNATIGVVLNEEGNLAVLPTMEKVYRSLPMSESYQLMHRSPVCLIIQMQLLIWFLLITSLMDIFQR